MFARTFKHSFILTALISALIIALIIAQQYVLGWMIPVLPAVHG